jgi:hypothetical protein
MVFPTEVATSQVVEEVTAIEGNDPEVPGKAPLVSLKTTFCDAGVAPPLELNNAVAGLASSTWVPACVTSNDTDTCVFPLGVDTVMVAV